MSEWQPIETMPEDNADDVDARFLQAAQSVAVVGEPVAWVNINKHGDVTRTVRRRDNWCTTPVFVKPKTSIPAAELATLRENAAEADELRKDAERYRWLRDGNDNKKSAACHIAVNCYGLEWDDAIDAAIAQERQP